MSESNVRVAIVVVNWNGVKDTIACLSSLVALNTKGCEVKIIVVDNGSTDSSVADIGRKFPNIVLLQSTQNLGFTGGNNHGIRYALGMGYEYVWLLNNDTVVEKDALQSLLYVFGNRNVGVAGSKIYFAPGREYHHDRYSSKERGHVIWYAGGIIDWSNMYAFHRGVDEVDKGQFDEITETQFVTGCSMMIRREVCNAIGLLDDRYFLYLEDVDFCIRAQRAGYKLLYVPKSIIWHTNAGSSERPGSKLHEYYQTRNRLLAGFLWAPWRTRFALAREALRFILFGSAIKRRAVFDAVSNKFGNQYTQS